MADMGSQEVYAHGERMLEQSINLANAGEYEQAGQLALVAQACFLNVLGQGVSHIIDLIEQEQ